MAEITSLRNEPVSTGNDATASGGSGALPPVRVPRVARTPRNHVTMEQALDKGLKAAQSKFTGGLSPIALASAYADWALHLSAAPGKQMELAEKAAQKVFRFANHAAACSINPDTPETCITPLPQDRRFEGEAWQKWPFNVMSQAFLLNQQWWHNATTGVDGVTRQHENEVTFAARQILDIFSPSNFALTNPEVLAKTFSRRRHEPCARMAELHRRRARALIRDRNPPVPRRSGGQRTWPPRRARSSIATG